MAKFRLDGRTWDTDKMVDMGISTREEHGVRICGVYMTPKTHRVFIETYSIWASRRNDGTVVGEVWHEADLWEIQALADRFDCAELAALVTDAPDSEY